jgi:hypothetical protein
MEGFCSSEESIHKFFFIHSSAQVNSPLFPPPAPRLLQLAQLTLHTLHHRVPLDAVPKRRGHSLRLIALWFENCVTEDLNPRLLIDIGRG